VVVSIFGLRENGHHVTNSRLIWSMARDRRLPVTSC